MSSSSWNGSKHTSAFLYYIFMVVFLVLTITKSKYWSALQMLKRGWEDGSLFVTVFATQVWGPESDAQNLAGYVRQPPKFPALEGEALEQTDCKRSYISELWVWLTDPASRIKVEEQWRTIPTINLWLPHLCTHTHTRTIASTCECINAQVCAPANAKAFIHTHACHTPHSHTKIERRKIELKLR